MRSPSAMVLINSVDIYFPVTVQDAVQAPEFTYPSATFRGMACSVQPRAVEEVMDEQQRVTQERQYVIFFAAATNVPPRSKIIYVDSSGVTHTLFAHIERDEAGRGAVFTVRAIEKV